MQCPVKCTRFYYFTDDKGRSLLTHVQENFKLRNHVTRASKVHSKAECGLLCSRDSGCRSFNLGGTITELLCELNYVTRADFKHDVHWTYTCSYYSAVTRSTLSIGFELI